MEKQLFKGFCITPDSYHDSDMPGYCFPSASVNGKSVAGVVVRLAPVRGIDKNRADALAVEEAKRRISAGQL